MYLVPVFQVADLTLAKLFFDDGDGLNGAVAFGECPTYIAPEVLRATMHPKTAPADNKGEIRVWEDTFEMYLRYRYMRGCIFCIFQILRYRYH